MISAASTPSTGRCAARRSANRQGVKGRVSQHWHYGLRMLQCRQPAKKRKKHKSPQAIEPATWDAVKAACVAGIGYSEAARVFGIRSPHAIIMKSRRDRWPIPSRVEHRAQALQARLQRRSETAQERRNGNDATTETLAQSWTEKGEAHRALAFQLAHDSLRKAAKTGPAN
jgi:hypothetical protein